MKPYNHHDIEKKWQDIWYGEGAFTAPDTSSKPKKYVLDMFPYPSGDGLHLGHVENYTATCIYSRYFHMKGFNVMHPIGWDAFGLPAENYAIKTGVHPDVSTHANIKNFTAQLKSLGISSDWSREIDTSSPEYYKWTQWFFLLLYKNGLAYKKKAKVNWCDSCKTVLANEQVESGKCERCKNQVVQKDLEQWFFKITDFADALINDLDQVDWPSSTIAAQRNWIGRSEGVEFSMRVSASDQIIPVYTTRIDTVFGMTYVVLAPEHPMVNALRPLVTNASEVDAYVAKTAEKTELERTELNKEKTGVCLEGVKAVNPFTNEEVQVCIGDYVLSNYGTGAVMAVPAHDERDFEFAHKMNLPIKASIAGFDGTRAYTADGALVDSGAFTGMSSSEARLRMGEFVEEQGIGIRKINYRLRDWLVSRQRYWGSPIPIIYCDTHGAVPVPEKDLPVQLPTDVDFRPTGESPLNYSQTFHEGVVCPECGKPARREVDTMDTFVCSSWYYLRFADPHNASAFASPEAIKQWLPVDMYMGGAEHTVLHLMYARFFTKVLHKLGYITFNEPFMKLRHQGIILAPDGRKMSKSLGNVISPNEIVDRYGADTIRLHEMFLGPLEDMKPWNNETIIGSRRFLERVWRLADRVGEAGDVKVYEATLHRTIKKVGSDIEVFALNTAISSMMILVNDMEKAERVVRADYEALLKLLAPFAPHITEELWHELGNTESIHQASWPTYDEAKCVAAEVAIAIQINGKVRDTIMVPAGWGEQEVRDAALARESVQKYVTGQDINKVIFVPGRLLSIVLGK